MPLSVLYPKDWQLSPTVRAFVDWVGGVVREADVGWRAAALPA